MACAYYFTSQACTLGFSEAMHCLSQCWFALEIWVFLDTSSSGLLEI